MLGRITCWMLVSFFAMGVLAGIPYTPGCQRMDDMGKTYRGQIYRTISGRMCQPWNAQIPHKHSTTPENFLENGLDQNYCRNPDGRGAVWCYTVDPTTEWEFCDVSVCRTDCWDALIQGVDYRGQINFTVTGKTCQRWDSQKPHGHTRTQKIYPLSGLIDNYCRNPDGEEGPWCYTIDSDSRWEYCPIPTCTGERPRKYAGCYNAHDKGASYRGSSNTTISGIPCQAWSKQSPHEHTRTPEKYPDSGLLDNMCRNPDGSGAPWCYTADNETRWEVCDIPKCTTECWVEDEQGESYRGSVAKTITGKTCQRWDSQAPHKHSRTTKNYPFSGLVENYCRNPDEEEMPWCYTTDPNSRWEYCPITSCSCKKQTQFFGCWNPADQGESYRGIAMTTITGERCKTWADQLKWDFPTAGLQNNYCRNPDGKNAPWCYTDDAQETWSPCCLTSCTNGCWDPEAQGANYRGFEAKSITGRKCMRWDSQSPHKHTRTPENYPFSGLISNYCRNPDGEPGPWCYTVDKESRWELCDIPICAAGCWSPIDNGVSYRGYASTTESGKTCQLWDSQMPHRHSWTTEAYRHAGLDGNYCRNPDGLRERPWCLTTDSSKKWEYCSIKTCFMI